jgi:hypothetical protein
MAHYSKSINVGSRDYVMIPVRSNSTQEGRARVEYRLRHDIFPFGSGDFGGRR